MSDVRRVAMLRQLHLFATLYRSLNDMRARHVDRTRAKRRQEAGAENQNSLRLLDTVTEHIPVVAVDTTTNNGSQRVPLPCGHSRFAAADHWLCLGW